MNNYRIELRAGACGETIELTAVLPSDERAIEYTANRLAFSTVHDSAQIWRDGAIIRQLTKGESAAIRPWQGPE